jgi:demethylmacrocin O-methyltransferase
MTKLTEIANKLGTDKGTDAYCKHSYTLTYEELFESLSDRHVKMLEIGVADPRFPGASIKMWKEYFSQLTFVGYDINEEALKFIEENVSIFIGDQNNPFHLQNCILKHGINWDIIIDDGSHHGEHVVTSFENLFKHIKPGGYYIIEDLHAVYMDAPKMIENVKSIIKINDYQVSEFFQRNNNKLLIIRKSI